MKHPRDGKAVYIGSTWRNFETEKDGKFAIWMVYEITERTTAADGQEMLFPEKEIDMYWTSLGVSDAEVIALYHNHAVCEQYHSEINEQLNDEQAKQADLDNNQVINVIDLTLLKRILLRQ